MEQYLTEEESSQPRKGFVKDSLQILMVKLIGVKQLDQKNLLEKDIGEHPQFYLNLLTELEKSDLDPGEYAFLDRKLAYLTKLKTEERLKWSLGLNAGLLFVLIGVVALAFRFGLKKRVVAPVALSRQEATIKNLILEGKTNKQIANELFISISTVKTHITNLYAKLNVSSRGELLQKSTGTST
ncbi:LuxR family transcriptional regulator [Flagellimonas allohymeniacidonis]|uniref:LuxR family transcriptional regulator n=2 Tax=Flagellimonas allohymeniacidonis TaxID=2517819 RepID=A0A4V2HSL4_9FLAO|nr:LuxR family transcriptional regulator [Allomuricauda hymeniacidonis]